MSEVRFYGPFVCGEHFCELCGDCMVHDIETPCTEGPEHACWVEAEPEEEA